MNKPKAKYFCENCGSEVAPNARFCPKCGKFFSSVRCPKCGCTGDVTKFKNGCPQCGYAMPLGNMNSISNENTKNKKLSKKSKKMISAAFSSYNGAAKQEQVQVNEDAPAWLFIVCILVLLGIILFIVWRMHF